MKRIGSFAILCSWFLGFLFLSGGCASHKRYAETVLDTPELYVSNGYKLIKTSRYEDAEREFSKALKHDPRNSQAFSGLALAKGYKGEREAALTAMKKSASLASGSDEEYKVQVGWIRLYSVLREEGWIKEAEKAYTWACSIARQHPEAYYYMGIAYKHECRIGEARSAFLRVLGINGSLVPEARNELLILKRMESAKPLSDFGRRLVVKERITRAEVAALFFHELRVKEVLKKEVPGAARAAASDIAAHPLRGEIKEIIALRIKGLTAYADGTFEPNHVVTRAAFAVMLADVISRAVKDPALVARHAESGSPFSDVKSDAPYLGAVLVCTAWGGEMEAENELFNPMGVLAGYDAVLLLQKIRGKLER
ncbi:MAG: hypothetical protein CVU64_14400 [Deltaproteobacteria bacterium HGW-Deltaproteobacteria-21]|nr:MAG: hypothetical protein CVU64_14400 [Deltaproteobacteria bacterium HGW-Deltaproteobacteria-21]